LFFLYEVNKLIGNSELQGETTMTVIKKRNPRTELRYLMLGLATLIFWGSHNVATSGQLDYVANASLATIFLGLMLFVVAYRGFGCQVVAYEYRQGRVFYNIRVQKRGKA
jgi:hypothetical protein